MCKFQVYGYKWHPLSSLRTSHVFYSYINLKVYHIMKNQLNSLRKFVDTYSYMLLSPFQNISTWSWIGYIIIPRIWIGNLSRFIVWWCISTNSMVLYFGIEVVELIFKERSVYSEGWTNSSSCGPFELPSALFSAYGPRSRSRRATFGSLGPLTIAQATRYGPSNQGAYCSRPHYTVSLLLFFFAIASL